MNHQNRDEETRTSITVLPRRPRLFFGSPGGTHVCLWPPSVGYSTRAVPDTTWVRFGLTLRTKPNTEAEVVPTVKWMYGGLVLRTVVRLVPGRLGDRLTSKHLNPTLWLMAMPANTDPATYGGERLAAFVARHGEDGLARAQSMQPSERGQSAG